MRCAAKTKSGRRCSRNARPQEKLCAQHGGLVKSNGMETLKRLEQVKTWLLEGQRTVDMLEAGRELWSLRRRRMHELIREARSHIAADSEASQRAHFDWHIEARLELYRRAVDTADVKAALSVLKDLAEMQGHYHRRPSVIPDFDVSSNGGIMEAFNWVIGQVLAGKLDAKLANSANLLLVQLMKTSRPEAVELDDPLEGRDIIDCVDVINAIEELAR